mgnify:CR=1 FL=1
MSTNQVTPLTVKSPEIKVLNSMLAESNDFKRYVLLNLWTSSLYQTTLTSGIDSMLKSITDESTPTDSDLYNMFRDLKDKLSQEVISLRSVLHQIQVRCDVLKVMNKALQIGCDKEVSDIQLVCKAIDNVISVDMSYIDHIDNLSEKQIATYRTDNK